MSRETWATRTGFILAAVGSAVGLGNVWRFPWITAANGGSAFLVVYLLVVLGVGVPGLLAEFVIGRRSRRSPVGALQSLSGSRAWAAVGAAVVGTSVVLLSFYSVVGGWVARYLLESAVAVGTGSAAYFAAPGPYFERVAFGVDAAAFHLAFLGATAGIVLLGVRRGIERGATLMMPAIVVLLLGLAVWAATRPGAAAGYEFLLRFDVGTVRARALSVLGPAAGQALFTLSLGVGTMITYASYLGEERSLPLDGATIAVINTGVGVLAGLVVFPLLAAQGVDPATTAPGEGALFVALAGAIAALPGGPVVATGFFAVVALAALSSSISMLEIAVSALVDEFGLRRRTAVAAPVGVVAVSGTLCALRPAVFGFVAGTLVDYLLTAGLAAFLLFVGWVLGRDALTEFRRGAGPLARKLALPWLAAVAVLLPLFLIFTLLSDLGVEAALGFWPTVVVTVLGGAAVAAALRHRHHRSVT